MENPEKEISAIMQSLASYPKSHIQEQVIRTYFSADVVLVHPYFCVKGADDLIAIYQLAQFCYKYREMEILDVLYDPAKNKLSVHTRLQCWPLWLMKPRAADLSIWLELEDFHCGDGRILKKIKQQHDFFFLSTLVALLPVIGDLYIMEWFRFSAGHAFARSYAFLRKLALAVIPKGVHQLIGL